MKKLAVYAMAIALSAPLYAATTHHHSSSWHSQFVKLDANKDGVVDATEAKANPALSSAFSTVAPTGKLDYKAFVAWKRSLTSKHKS